MKHTSHKKQILLFLLILLSSIFVISCALFQSLGDKNSFVDAVITPAKSISEASEPIDSEEEYYIGREVASIILGDYQLYTNSELEKYLNLICMTLVINSNVPEIFNGYHVGILNTDEINAFATSGGHILVTRGLLQCAKSEDALAGVIAHELGHIQLKHGIKAIKANRISSAVMKSAGNITLGEKKSADMKFFSEASESIVTTMVNSGYSKLQEYDADKFAVKLMAKSGYDPNAMCEMLTTMSKKQENDKRGFGKTHPSASSRIQKVNRTAKKLSGEYYRSVREARYSQIRIR